MMCNWYVSANPSATRRVPGLPLRMERLFDACNLKPLSVQGRAGYPLGGGGVCGSGIVRAAVTSCLVWSTITTVLLHWLPLSGYVYEGRYFIDAARRELPLLALFDAFPVITPAATSNLLGLGLLLIIWTIAWTVSIFTHQ